MSEEGINSFFVFRGDHLKDLVNISVITRILYEVFRVLVLFKTRVIPKFTYFQAIYSRWFVYIRKNLLFAVQTVRSPTGNTDESEFSRRRFFLWFV